jgi:pimeloyl-ACP methyl ester carboxylesterase
VLVFVHGVPETAAIWNEVRDALGSESIALSLPGFGCLRPDGFGATMDDYANFLADELGHLGGPIDLVGHDWGGLLTMRIAQAQGGLVRSWVADVAAGFHESSVWHDFAKIWQTPGEGEAFFERQLDTPPEQVAAVMSASFRVPEEGALRLASWMDATMASCILDLYRSATPNVAAHWGTPSAPTLAPGLILAPTEDPFSSSKRLSSEVADRLGARREVLQDIGHFWPLEAPQVGAAAIARFLDTVR